MCCDHGLPGGGVARLEHYRVYSYRALHQADSSKLIIQALIIGSRTPHRPRPTSTHKRGRAGTGGAAGAAPGIAPDRAVEPPMPHNHREHGAATAITLHPREPHSAARMPVSLLLCLTPPRLLSLSSFLSSPRGNPFRHPCPRFSASLRSGPPSINLRIRRHEASRGVIRRHQAPSGAIRRHQAPSGAIRHHRAHHLSASAPLKDPSARASIARVSHRSPSMSRAEASPRAAGRHPSA